MRVSLLAVMVLLLSASVSAEAASQVAVSDAKLFLMSINPILFLVAGVILIIASSMAKYIGIALLLIGIASLVITLF